MIVTLKINTENTARWLVEARRGHATEPDRAIISLRSLHTHGWIPIADEYGAQLRLMDAICLGKQSYLCQCFPPRLFSVSLSLCPSREKSVSVISDIYSLDGSRGARARHRNAGTYEQSGRFKCVWELGLCFH